jgi:hypothetical protein
MGWFVQERAFNKPFKRLNPHHPLFDSRPINEVDAMKPRGGQALTHTSRFVPLVFHLYTSTLAPEGHDENIC